MGRLYVTDEWRTTILTNRRMPPETWRSCAGIPVARCSVVFRLAACIPDGGAQ